jgi:nucleoid-associated protein YgaU
MFARIAICLGFLALVVALAARPSGGAGHEQVYVVRSYDTLWSIATARYAGDPRAAIDRIERRNGLSGAMLTPGERLVLPP